MPAAALAMAALVACAPLGPAPSPPAASTSHAPSPSSTPEAAPTLVPDGTATDNLPVFTAVTAQVWQSEQRVSGRAYIDALVAAGFDRASMQLTEDTSTVGNPAESIQFSVQWAQECLIGQVGPATGDPVTTVMAALPEGGCLVGETRPIDW
jgi:hypothetical protein